MEREVSEVDRKLILKRIYLDKIDFYLTRNSTEQDELYTLVRRFFAEYLKLDYEFTYEELSLELNKVFIRPKVKEHIDDFLIRLSESEYLEENALSLVGVNSFLRELDEIIKNMIFDDQEVKEEDVSVLQKVLNIKPKLKERIVDLQSLRLVLEEINFYITNGQLDTAKKTYMDLLKAYEKLKQEDKKKLHDDMTDLYDRLQSAVRNPSSQTVKTEVMNDVLKKLNEDIDETMFFIDSGNFVSAKNSYTETLKVYDSLNAEDKKIIHQKLDETYKKLHELSSKSKRVGPAQKTSSIIPGAIPTISGDVVSDSSMRDLAIDDSFDKQVAALNIPPSTSSSMPFFDSKLDPQFDSKSDPGLDSFDSLTTGSKGGVNTDGKNTIAGFSKIKTESTKINAAIEEHNIAKVPSFSKSETGNSIFQAEEDISSMKTINIGFSDVRDGVRDMTRSDVNGRSNLNLNEVKKDETTQRGNKNTQGDETTQSGNTLFNFGSDYGLTKNPVSTSTSISASLKELDTSKPASNYPSASSNAKSKDLPSSPILPYSPQMKISQKSSLIEKDFGSNPEILPDNMFMQSQNLNDMDVLLRKISDDILIQRIDPAANSYRDALALYKSMNVEDKKKCYDKLFATFKKLDEEIHKKSLNDVLDNHMLMMQGTKRAVSSGKNKINGSRTDRNSQINPSNSRINPSKVQQVSNLPVALNNDDAATRIYELIEESYFNVEKENADLASLKYFRALDLYRQLSTAEKKKLYSGLHDLFVKLSNVKKMN